MSDIVSPLLQWLNANPELAGLATFIISAAESIAIIGTIVPGSITMTAIGTLAGAGIIPLYQTLLWATLGAIVGDGISYWLGYYFKNSLRNAWPFKNNPHILATGEAFVHKYGTMSVFIGRFVGPVRALVPLVAGMLGMKPLKFAIANVASAIGWAPVYMLPGILLGAASLELPPDIAVHVILVLFLIILFILLCLWIAFKLFQLLQLQVEQSLVRIWDSLKHSRHFHVATTLLKHHNPQQHHGQLTRLFYFLLVCFLLFGLISYVHALGPNNILTNEALFHLFRGIRSPTLDKLMLNISLFGQKEVILPVVFIVFLWLFIVAKRMRAAMHILSLAILTSVSIYGLKNLVKCPRPWGVFANSESFSLPSGHTTLATALYVGIAFIIASQIRAPSKRKLLFAVTFILAFAIGISRMYLGAHWFTDVLAGWLLGTAIIILVILSYHRQKAEPIRLRSLFLVGFISLVLSFSFYHYKHFARLEIAFAQVDWPTSEITMATWWQKDNNLPALRVSLFGFPSQRLNIEWVGNLADIKNTLFSEGWETPPARDWISTLHRIADIESVEYLPLISSQYLDKKPVLTLAKYSSNGKRMLVIRLWASNCTIKDNNHPLWVGTIGYVPRTYSWIFRKSQRDLAINGKLIFATGNEKLWETKTISILDTHRKNKPVKQVILLIRKK